MGVLVIAAEAPQTARPAESNFFAPQGLSHHLRFALVTPRLRLGYIRADV